MGLVILIDYSLLPIIQSGVGAMTVMIKMPSNIVTVPSRKHQLLQHCTLTCKSEITRKLVNRQGPVWQEVSAEQGVGGRGRLRCRTKPEARKGQGQTHWEGFAFAVKETQDL